MSMERPIDGGSYLNQTPRGPHAAMGRSGMEVPRANTTAGGFEMKKLYDVQVVEPFAVGSACPSRLGYQTIAWCEGLDLIAVVSGCGGVAVFHADSPGENALLTTPKKAVARHVAWRPAGRLSPLLLVADTAGRLTFWGSKYYRVNVWKVVGQVSVRPSIMAVGWTRDASMVTAVLSHGTICVWRIVHNASGEFKIHALEAMTNGPSRFGANLDGQIKCASIAPGGVSGDMAAVLTVMASKPSNVDVWHISPFKAKPDADPAELKFQRKSLGSVVLENEACIACLAAPPAGVLFAWGESGTIGRWILARNDGRAQQAGESPWVKDGSCAPFQAPNSKPRVTSVYIAMDGYKVITADAQTGLKVIDWKHLGDYWGNSLDSEHRPHWGLCFSPSGFCVTALTGDGVVQLWAITSPRPTPQALAEQLIQRTTEDGRRGCWDVLAVLVKLGKETAASVAKMLAKYQNEKIDTLRLAVLSAVDVNTAAVAAARKLLEAAISAIQMSSGPSVTSKLNMYQMEPGTFSNSENVLRVVNEAVLLAQSTAPRPVQLAAAPLADWVMLLCMVWLRRAARAVERNKELSLRPEWRRLVEADLQVADDRTSVVKDPSLTRSLRNASIATAILIALEDEFGDQDIKPRYLRLKREDMADVVAALWDTSAVADLGIDSNVDAVANALSRHPVAAAALNNKSLLIDSSEKALGIRGSAYSAGFTLACAREEKFVNPESLGKAPEWCPYDIVTGRPLPPWVSLRRCVVSGLLAAEMTAPRTDGESAGNSTLVPWAQRWANESPFGGLWLRMPSLDLDRFELMPAAVRNDDVASVGESTPSQQLNAAHPNAADPNVALSSSTVGPETGGVAQRKQAVKQPKRGGSTRSATSRDQPADGVSEATSMEGSRKTGRKAKSKSVKDKGGDSNSMHTIHDDTGAAGPMGADDSSKPYPGATESSVKSEVRRGPTGQSQHTWPSNMAQQDLGSMRAPPAQTQPMMDRQPTPQQRPMSRPMPPQGVDPGLHRNSIWNGMLTVRSSQRVLNVPCIALPKTIDSAPPLRDATGWPRALTCDANRLNEFENLRPRATSEHAQWYVEFVPIDENTRKEIQNTRLTDLVRLMFQQKLAFELPCEDHPTHQGTLILFGSSVENNHKLIGVYLPRQPTSSSVMQNHRR